MFNNNTISNSTANFGQANNLTVGSKPNDITTLYNIDNCLLSKITSIYQSYIPGTIEYKFKHLFYNISENKIIKPINMSDSEWQKIYINDYLMPVELNYDEIVQRVQKQNDLILKLNNSKYVIIQSIENLNNKKNIIIGKIKQLIYKFRRISKQYIVNDDLLDSNFQVELGKFRNKLYIVDEIESKKIMDGIKYKLQERIKQVKNDLKDLEQGGLKYQIEE